MTRRNVEVRAFSVRLFAPQKQTSRAARREVREVPFSSFRSING
jgi:hypothetical protein